MLATNLLNPRLSLDDVRDPVLQRIVHARSKAIGWLCSAAALGCKSFLYCHQLLCAVDKSRLICVFELCFWLHARQQAILDYCFEVMTVMNNKLVLTTSAMAHLSCWGFFCRGMIKFVMGWQFGPVRKLFAQSQMPHRLPTSLVSKILPCMHSQRNSLMFP